MTDVEFGPLAREVMTGREPGTAKLSWSPGVFEDGRPAWDAWDGELESHLLVGGIAGSGKTVLLSSMIHQLAHNNGPSELRLWFVDPRGDMGACRDLDLTERFVDSWTPCDNYLQNALDLIEDAGAEMCRRLQVFASFPEPPKDLIEAREIAQQESARAGIDLSEHPFYMPYLFVFLPEGATLFAESASGQDRNLRARLVAATVELARKGRSAGIYLISTTHYVTNASIPSAIRDHMRRIGMRCQNSLASTMLIGEPGLEDIRTKGSGKLASRDGYRTFRGYWVKED